MVLALVFAQVWGILELIALGSFSRTLRLRTILLALVAGVYICGPLTLVVQLTWVKLYAAMTGAYAGNVARVGGYTVDPFLEELLKVLPLILILSFARVRARWAITDCILIGAALGAGFGLAEDLLRYGALPHLANPDADGWTMGTNLSLPYIPGFMLSLTSWLPAPSASTSIFYGQAGYPWVNCHLVWSSLGGFAVGLIAIDRRTASVIAGGVLAFYIGIDHAAWNAEQAFGSTAREVLAAPLAAIRGALPFLPLVAIAIAYWLDRGRQPGPGALDTLVKRLTATRSAATASAQRWPTQLPGALRSLASIAGVLSIVAALPWVLWFVVGGWPQTASVQQAMTSGIGWTLLRIASVIAFALLVRRLLAMLREWARVRQESDSEDLAAFMLRGGTVVGALVMLAVALRASLTSAGAGASVISLYHILENCSGAGCAPGNALSLGGGGGGGGGSSSGGGGGGGSSSSSGGGGGGNSPRPRKPSTPPGRRPPDEPKPRPVYDADIEARQEMEREWRERRAKAEAKAAARAAMAAAREVGHKAMLDWATGVITFTGGQMLVATPVMWGALLAKWRAEELATDPPRHDYEASARYEPRPQESGVAAGGFRDALQNFAWAQVSLARSIRALVTSLERSDGVRLDQLAADGDVARRESLETFAAAQRDAVAHNSVVARDIINHILATTGRINDSWRALRVEFESTPASDTTTGLAPGRSVTPDELIAEVRNLYDLSDEEVSIVTTSMKTLLAEPGPTHRKPRTELCDAEYSTAMRTMADRLDGLARVYGKDLEATGQHHD